MQLQIGHKYTELEMYTGILALDRSYTPFQVGLA